ncbi:hypothetical protein PC123_g20338 [Phytophthora cactorum]|nr:hypothetical protein PC123_g20338 [Phytophthora cactorum]
MEETRRYTNLAPVCEETITHDMENVTKAVERSIGDELPEEIGGDSGRMGPRQRALPRSVCVFHVQRGLPPSTSFHGSNYQRAR